MPSFDVVSRLDFQEIDNAIGNATREIGNRYDFKGSDTSIERKENDLTVIAEAVWNTIRPSPGGIVWARDTLCQTGYIDVAEPV